MPWPPQFLDELPAFGIAPHADTAPLLVRDYLNDLYRYEIRRLRARLLAGEFPKSDYIERVVALRRKYFLLSLTPQQWTSLIRVVPAPSDSRY